MKPPGLEDPSQIPGFSGMNMMREIGNNVVGSTSPMVRSPPVSPRSLQRVHAVHGPGMSSDKRMTSPKGSMSRMMRMSSGSDLRGWLKIGNICSVTTTKTCMKFEIISLQNIRVVCDCKPRAVIIRAIILPSFNFFHWLA